MTDEELDAILADAARAAFRGRLVDEHVPALVAEVRRLRDTIQVTGELAQEYGVNPPLDGRIHLGPGCVFELSSWDGQGLNGRIPGTYIGKRVSS